MHFLKQYSLCILEPTVDPTIKNDEFKHVALLRFVHRYELKKHL